jgi:hypothetical protein
LAADDVAVLLFDGRLMPTALAGLPVLGAGDLDAVADGVARLIVVGTDADLAAVLTRLLRTERLDVEIGFVSDRRSPATRAYRLAPGRRGARRALVGVARRVPLIRDDTGVVIVGGAEWRGTSGPLHGEAVVDDTTLFDGVVAGVRVEPIGAPPGLRAAVLTPRGRPRRWVSGRAAQLGCTGVLVSRDGVAADRRMTRFTCYRHTVDWLLVR